MPSINIPDSCQHPLRQQLTDELHARPFINISKDADIVMFVVHSGEDQGVQQIASLRDLLQTLGCDAPDDPGKHFVAVIQDDLLRWERHGEFTTYCTRRYIDPGATGSDSAFMQNVFEHVAKCAGQLLVATHLQVRAKGHSTDSRSSLVGQFCAESLVSSRLGSLGNAWTDVKINEDGFNRILLEVDDFAEQDIGRTCQQLLDISTYRNMALLGFFKAQQLSSSLVIMEKRLTGVLEDVNQLHKGNRHSVVKDIDILNHLTALAAELQHAVADTQYRFGATRAYRELVYKRLEDLDEQSGETSQTIGKFLKYRFEPAMRTCDAIAARLESLSKRVSRASGLIRTRLDVAMEQQNADLLRSMDRRAKLQLRLQETVEGLSIAAITYYCVGLIGYLAKGAEKAGLAVDANWITGLSVIPVALLVALAMRRWRKRFADNQQSDVH